ncbi:MULTISPECIES: SurA N-terminal domain-containing protein [Nitrincola]|uniref:Periplasmic chaperone PpiD n=1 Tax=Nitrincola nitratireducens TaxID=1229521 RepID=W9V5W2_9GAMM|nr:MULTISPECIES: SurA N-terminal domain-containing protein [Nitrincola]EXJ11497.1 Peptidyl-prolyl cis-trans isomerase D [Nitrincola nitratireducens]
MLQSIRDNSKGIIAKIIVGLIALTFALFGVESLVGLGSSEKPVATVNGEAVSTQELMRGVELQRRQILSQMGPDADPTMLDDNLLNRMVLESLIERSLLSQSVEKQGLYFSEEMLDQLIVNTPQFQVDGRFDRNQFEMVLRSAGFTPLTYRELLRLETLIDQERAGYVLSSFMTRPEIERIVSLDQQTRDFAYVNLPLLPILNQVSVTEEEIRARYDQNAAALQTEEQVILDYVLLEKVAFVDPEQVSDSEVESLYQQALAEFRSEELRDAAHILIEVDEQRDALAALARIQEVKLKLEEGEDFATLAQMYSDDIGSASEGGALGFMSREMLVGAFAETLFAMETVGSISEPFQTEFGYHLIKLEGVKQEEMPSRADLEMELRYEIAERDAERFYVEALERLADLSFSSADLVAPSEELGLEVMTSEAISRKGGTGLLGGHPRVLDAAFSQDVLRDRLNSLPIELDRERAVVVRLNQHQPSRQVTFEEARDSIELELITEVAKQQLRGQADAWLASFKNGEVPQDMSDEYSWVDITGVNRGAQDVSSEIRNAAFAMSSDQLPAFEVISLRNGNFALLRLDSVNRVEADLTEDEMAFMLSFLGSNQGQIEYEGRVQGLRQAATIERN